jgi:hypothetical protein
MEMITNKLKQTMAECNEIAIQESIEEIYTDYLENMSKELAIEKRRKYMKNKISITTTTTSAEADISEKINCTIKQTESIEIDNELQNTCKNTRFKFEQVELNLIKKYSLDHVEFKGKRHHGKCYCILINKCFDKVEIFKYVQALYQVNKNAIISICEEEDNFYMIKYKLSKYPDFQTPKRFKPKNFNSNLTNQIKIFEVKKRKYFIRKFKSLGSNALPSITSEYLTKVISGNNDVETKNVLEILLRENYQELKVKYINEFNCSLMMAIILFACSKKKTRIENSSFVYSFEKNMVIENDSRRCDGIYIHKHILVIFEWKNNVYKKECPLEYIFKRDYVRFVLEYLKNFEPYILKNINKVRRIGIEFFGKNKDYKVNVSIEEDLNVSEFAKDSLR